MSLSRGNFLALLTAAILLTIMLAAPASAQCAMCRSLLKTPEGQKLVAGFRSGIFVLLGAPFLAFSVVAALAIRAQRRSSLLEGSNGICTDSMDPKKEDAL